MDYQILKNSYIPDTELYLTNCCVYWYYEYMIKSTKQKDTKKQYEQIVKLVAKAEKAAEKFILQNKKVDSQMRVKYSSL